MAAGFTTQSRFAVSVSRRGMEPLCVTAVLFLAVLPQVALGQRNRRARPAPDPNTTSAIVQSSAPVEAFFTRAQEGLARQDWKLVVDSLQRIIDDPQGSLFSRNDQIFESSRRQAYRMLAELPEAGRSTYHLLYDSEAQALLKDAIAAHDRAALQRVVDRYLLTSAGLRAATVLASWMLDTGSPAAAATVLTTADDLCDAAAQDKAPIPALLAIAYQQLDWGDQATNQLQRLESVASGDAVWTARLTQLRSYTDNAHHAGSQAGTSNRWIAAYGNPRRGGRMPAIEPAMLEGLPWRVELPGGATVGWHQLLERRAREPSLPLLPTQSVITDGQTIFTKGGRRIMALDPVSFDVLWEVRPPAEELDFDALPRQVRNRTRVNQANRTEQRDEQAAAAALIDDLGNQMSVGSGLVYALDAQPDRDRQTQLQRINRRAPLVEFFLPNRLVAYDIDDGSVTWSIGKGAARTSSHFRRANFAAAPLPVGPNLLLPYWMDKDLYFGFLDPLSGALVDELHLCTLRDNLTEHWRFSLPPAVDETLAFMPTNGGLMIAIDLVGRSVNWASRYERSNYAPQRPERLWQGLRSLKSNIINAIHWLPGPPVVAGGVVLLAPADAAHLLAFDRATGAVVWKRERGDSRYIIAADSRHAWLGGPQIIQIDVRTGETVWETDVTGSTARAVLSGDHVLVPTLAALQTIDAQTGELLNTQRLPQDHLPLGNLLCSGGALYSVDTQEVRKFPDLDRSYAESQRMHQASPVLAAPAIRLAWMELLREAPQQVLDVLDRVDRSKLDDRQTNQIAHLQAQALILGARQQTWSADETESRLEQAVDVALSPKDRVEAALALTRHLHTVGRAQDAMRQAWDSLQRQPIGQMVNHGPGWRRQAAALLNDALSELLDDLPEEDLETLVRELKPPVLDEPATAKRRADVADQLSRIAHGPGLGHWNYQAALKLGRWKTQLREFEKAEYFLGLAHDLASSTDEQAVALHSLGQMYMRDDLELPGLAKPIAQRLLRDYARFEVAGRPVTEVAGEWLDQIRREGTLAPDRPDAAPSASSEWTDSQMLSSRLVNFSQDLPVRLGDIVLLMNTPRRLIACRATDGKLLWQCTLRMLTEAIYEPETVSAGRGRNAPVARADLSGQTILINTESSLHAVGLASGRRLWSVPFEYPVSSWAQSRDHYDIAGRYVAIRQGPHRVQLRRSVAGSGFAAQLEPRVEWDVRVSDLRVARLEIRDDRVLVFGEGGRDVKALDVGSGAVVFQTRLDNGVDPLRYKPPCVAGALWGVKGQHLLGIDLFDGRVRVNEPLPDDFRAVSVFGAGSEWIVVGGRMGRVMALEPGAGESMFTLELPFADIGVFGGTLHEGLLLLSGYSQGNSLSQLGLAAVDLDTGEHLWIRDRS